MFLLMAVLLTACQNSEEEVKTPDDGEDCFLEIAVSAPEHLLFTRGDVGEIASSEAERTVHSLQIWVFKSKDGSLVCYRNLTDFTSLNVSPYQQTYKMIVDKTFAEVRDNVDIYVVANAASYLGTTVLGENSKPADLNAAMIDEGSFGTSTLIKTPNGGLPMSAILKNQTIYGSFPALRIGTQEQPVVLELTRAISKLRFVLCRIEEEESSTKTLVSINSIKLNGNSIPTTTYLMPGTYNYSSYVSDDITFEDDDFDENHKLLPDKIPHVVNPLVYAYETQAAQDYENLIDAAFKGDIAWLKQYGIEKDIDDLKNLDDNAPSQLKQLGLTYLRESDKQLTGTISYTYKDNGIDKTPDPVTFSMAQAGDFLRNHSWIVYIYYMDSKIHVLTVTHIGMKEWTDGNSDDVKVYNW